jgi:hypothetical protein
MKINLTEIGRGEYESQSIEVRDPMAELRTEGPKILKFPTGMWGCGLDSTGSCERPVVSFCEHRNETSGSIICLKFNNSVSNY